jgi:hypothetical protein
MMIEPRKSVISWKVARQDADLIYLMAIFNQERLGLHGVYG